mmetsp:Transcript_17590/g.34598  ORF Transcript_17590/g.34598 Transcript_17590/m.34598 type:complete len:482 (+) Transcript_17590:573-2018(+)
MPLVSTCTLEVQAWAPPSSSASGESPSSRRPSGGNKENGLGKMDFESAKSVQSRNAAKQTTTAFALDCPGALRPSVAHGEGFVRLSLVWPSQNCDSLRECRVFAAQIIENYSEDVNIDVDGYDRKNRDNADLYGEISENDVDHDQNSFDDNPEEGASSHSDPRHRNGGRFGTSNSFFETNKKDNNLRHRIKETRRKQMLACTWISYAQPLGHARFSAAALCRPEEADVLSQARFVAFGFAVLFLAAALVRNLVGTIPTFKVAIASSADTFLDARHPSSSSNSSSGSLNPSLSVSSSSNSTRSQTQAQCRLHPSDNGVCTVSLPGGPTSLQQMHLMQESSAESTSTRGGMLGPRSDSKGNHHLRSADLSEAGDVNMRETVLGPQVSRTEGLNSVLNSEEETSTLEAARSSTGLSDPGCKTRSSRTRAEFSTQSTEGFLTIPTPQQYCYELVEARSEDALFDEDFWACRAQVRRATEFWRRSA